MQPCGAACMYAAVAPGAWSLEGVACMQPWGLVPGNAFINVRSPGEHGLEPGRSLGLELGETVCVQLWSLGSGNALMFAALAPGAWSVGEI